MSTSIAPDGTFVSSNDPELGAVLERLGAIEGENYRMHEALLQVDQMLDDKGWTPIYDYGNGDGLTLHQVKQASRQLRELVVGNPFVKQGSLVRSIYIWGAGVQFSLKRADGSPADLTAALRTFVNTPKNRRYVFGAAAQAEFETAAFTDGTLFLLGDRASNTFERVPISQITGDLRNPDNAEEIWAYRRVWNRNPQAAEQQADMNQQIRWYFTDLYDGKPYRSINSPLWGTEPVDNSKVLVDIGFNKQVGWAYGVPDSLAIIAWAKLYREFLVNGYVMSRSLAKFAYRVTTSSATGSTNVAQQLTLPGQAGSAAVMGSGNDMSAMTSAGKGYDFTSGRPLAEAMAAGLGVSLNALLASPVAGGADGTSLDGPARAMGIVRRRQWDDAFSRIFGFGGNQKDLVATWTDLTDDQLQRVLQAWTLTNNTGLFPPEPIQAGIAKAMKLPNPGAIPEGYMIPNNSKSLDRLDIDTDGQTGADPAQGDQQTAPTKPAKGTTGSGGSNAGNGQGKASGVGKGSNDHSTD